MAADIPVVATLPPCRNSYKNRPGQVWPGTQEEQPVPLMLYYALEGPPTYSGPQSTMRVIPPRPRGVPDTADHAGTEAQSLVMTNAHLVGPASDIHIHINRALPAESTSAAPKSGSFSEEKWDQMQPTIRRLYLDEAKSLEQVMGIMAAVYGFKATEKMYKSRFRKWGLAKNARRDERGSVRPRPNGNPTRTRPKSKALPSKGQFLGVPTPALHGVVRPPPPRLLESPTTLRHQEMTVHCVGTYISALFQSKGWLPEDRFALTPPAGCPNHGDTWLELDDKVFGASVLMESASIKDGFAALESVFQSLQNLAPFAEPYVMVKFWPICHRMNGICEKMGNHELLYGFFRYFGALSRLRPGPTHPMTLLLDQLSHVAQKDVMDTLRLGYFKSIRCLGDMVGSDHAIVLKMLSNYVKYWDKQGYDQNLFVADFTRLLEAADVRSGRNSEMAIRTLHSFTYALYYNSGDRAVCRHLAEDLLARTTNLPTANGQIQWSIETQSYAFTSRILASMALEQGDMAGWSAYLNNAVLRLSTGDLECRTRAIMLMDDLKAVLLDSSDIAGLELLEQRRSRLLAMLETQTSDA